MIPFYPGCTLGSSARPYACSLYWVFERLGLEIRELPGWTCCGATSAHALNRDLAYALPARNLNLAQQHGDELMVACSACYNRLKATQRALQGSEVRARTEHVLEESIRGALDVQIKNVLEILPQGSSLERIERERTGALEGRKVACYYGCLLTRIPRAGSFDAVENPTSMEKLVTAAGADAVDWPCKTSCCGATLSVIDEGIALRMCGRILEMARRWAADLIVTSCPFCQYNLDWAQWRLSREGAGDRTIPVIFITQLVGLALGGSDEELMLGSILAGAEAVPGSRVRGP